jgi:hypothetical protein
MESEDSAQGHGDKRIFRRLRIQVDFRNYKAVSGLQWGFDIIHWYGGKGDYRITVTDVKVNRPLPDTIFQ